MFQSDLYSLNSDTYSFNGDASIIPEIARTKTLHGNVVCRQLLEQQLSALSPSDATQHFQRIEMMMLIAETYLYDSDFSGAKTWFKSTRDQCLGTSEHNSTQMVNVLSRLAQVCAFLGETNELEEQLDSLVRAYLGLTEENISHLLHPLVDLSWTLCFRRHIEQAQVVNKIIAQVKFLEEIRISGQREIA